MLFIDQAFSKFFPAYFFRTFIYAAEQKARAVYDNILRLSDDPDVNEVIKFLRQREIIHFQRFGEAKRKLTSKQKAHSLYCFAAPLKYKGYDIES